MREEDIHNKICHFLFNHSYYAKNLDASSRGFLNIPVLSKADARKISSMSTGDFFTRTSGSSGDFLNVWWNYDDYLFSLSHLWRRRREFGVHPKDNYCTNHAIVYNRFLNPLNHKVIRSGNCLSLSKMKIDDDIMRRYVFEIKSHQPSLLLFQPSFAYLLGSYLLKSGDKLPDSIRLLELTGEMVDGEMYALLTKLFQGCSVRNMYGLQEFNGVAYGDANSMEILGENVFVEILNRDKDGVGDIVLTTLANSAMPLVRYKTGDKGIFVEGSDDKCIKIIEARSNDSFAASGVRYDGSVFLLITERINAVTRIIEGFKYVLQNNVLRCFFQTSAAPDDSDHFATLVKEVITSYFGEIFDDIVVLRGQELPRDGDTAKIKYFINNDKEVTV